MYSGQPCGEGAIDRRAFLRASGAVMGLTIAGAHGGPWAGPNPVKGTEVKTLREFLDYATLERVEVDRFLDSDEPNWAQFDPELGYTLKDSIVRDGVDGAYTIGRYDEAGNRKLVNFADRPCRMNAYGDSFTMCHQVSDGETWEEQLAAHLGEPIRNFGVGGYGVYQAYRRLVRTESSDMGVPYVMLNVWGIDDHYRSLDAWRYLRCIEWFKAPESTNMFHANPWVHVRFDPATGDLIEKENLCPTPESLYQLCDKDYVYQTFADDIIVRMFVAQFYGIEVPTDGMGELAACLGLELSFDGTGDHREAVSVLYKECALRASMKILEKAREFVQGKGKELMVLLSYGDLYVIEACEGKPRWDQAFVDSLDEQGFRYVDAIAEHVKDYQAFRLSSRAYANRYYIGHYNPLGNHFFAFAVKNKVVDWLDPKPIAYAESGASIQFKDYLRRY